MHGIGEFSRVDSFRFYPSLIVKAQNPNRIFSVVGEFPQNGPFNYTQGIFFIHFVYILNVLCQ